MNKERTLRCIGSAVWAAYGDALGFISELTDEAGLHRRTQGRRLDHPMSWKRRIGGRQGVVVDLPPGCYSDDTQLRLSVGRAIGPHGFDVEAFAKVELTVWPSYALGGGKGTKAAAVNLAKDRVTWYTNTFSGWTEAGGNGAAMRIQPHVWSARDLDDPHSYLPEVVRDAICTHGSPTGILGSVLHAMFVAHAIQYGEVPDPVTAANLIQRCRRLNLVVPLDSEISIWMGLWERERKMPFEEGWRIALDEAHGTLAEARRRIQGSERSFHDLLSALELFSPSRRGGGLLTSIAALALLWFEPDIEGALIRAANMIGSDTDTIATMAGAVGGAVTQILPKYEVLDLKLIRSEAERLSRVGSRKTGPRFHYPDLLYWSPPKSQADVLVQHHGQMHVLGLGSAEPIGSDKAQNGAFGWQWVMTEFGQTLLIKRREDLTEVRDLFPMMGDNGARNEPRPRESTVSRVVQETLLAEDPPQISDVRPNIRPRDRGVNLDEALEWLGIHGMDDDSHLGYVIRRVARDGTSEQLILLLGALRDRLRQ